MRNTAHAVSVAAVSAVRTVTCWLAGGPAAGVASTSASTVAVLADALEDSSDNSNWG